MNPSVPEVNLPAVNNSQRKLIYAVVFLLVIFITLISTGVAIAYEKIKLNIPSIEKPITQFVMGLPFTPKTPKFLLQSAVAAHANISKHRFNVSLAATSESLVPLFGLNQIDAEIKGSVDYSDPKNLKTTFNSGITKDLNFDIRKKDDVVYIKINKFPAALSAMMKLDQEKVMQILQDWISFDTSHMDTQARRYLDSRSSQKSFTKEYITNVVEDVSDERFLASTDISKESLDNKPTYYKLHIAPERKTLDDFVNKIGDRADARNGRAAQTTKFSDQIKDFVIDIWIDEKSHYIHRIKNSFKFNANPNAPADSVSIVTVVDFDDFGKDFTIDIPEKYIKSEEFIQKIMQASGSNSGGTSSEGGGLFINTPELTKRARDAARLTDLANLQQGINVVMQESTRQPVKLLCADSGFYPCRGSSEGGKKSSDGTGWLKVDLSSPSSILISILPVDPVNDLTTHYTYCANNDNWEINTVLESDQQKGKMAADGGDDPTKYEVGSNLNLIGKVCIY